MNFSYLVTVETKLAAGGGESTQLLENQILAILGDANPVSVWFDDEDGAQEEHDIIFWSVTITGVPDGG